MVVYEVDELEYIIRNQVAQFLEGLGPSAARNLGITQKRWVVRARGCFHRVTRRILNKDKILGRKF